ncbi:MULTISPECIES: LCP family protein [unclassified Streptomyces]|uniref:LCP family protein n=1 Tax=unclassified Streptomyces TaxID=2593676 RepID=UPI000C27903E|nr:LCP family protein [Streptomyces sp. CB01201]MBX7471422.1 LCP family protein [Streptomyces sp. MAG02]PJN04344.1 transcriptional regulator [Streptomyces sp. CB01201]
MNEWPDARNGNARGNGEDAYGRGSSAAQPEGARRMRHVQRPVPQQQPAYDDGYGQQPGYAPGVPGQGSYDSGYSEGHVYGSPAGRGPAGPGGPGGPQGPRRGARRPGAAPNWRKRITVGALALVAVLLVTSVATYFWADGKVRREVDLSKVIDRPDTGKGTNYLIVGSDSRDGMSADEKKKLHTGSADGKRTDSMILLHVGDNGNTMVSLPRDSWVTIPSFKGSQSGKAFPSPGKNKLNAAFSIDGPELLVRTIEANTGLHIDHYAEIGFAGFANIVDAVGGVELDIPQDIKDKDSGADFKKGKQTLDGQQALAFVRNRHGYAAGDLERTKNQQKFLSALASQTATPTTILNPFKLYPVMGAGLDTLIVDKDMSLFDLGSMFWAMKGITGGDGLSMNMPVAGDGPQTSLLWDKPKVTQLVNELKNDDKVTVK